MIPINQDWRIIGYQEEYIAFDYDDIYLTIGVIDGNLNQIA